MSDSGSVNNLSRQLSDGLTALGFSVHEHPVDAYLSYLSLLTQWNRAYNLTSAKKPERMLAYHILDSLSVLPYLHGEHCLDIGTGAGLPGLILALARPETHWILLDSNRKKIRFVNHAILELKIGNVETVCSRIEDFKSGRNFSTIVARAYGSLIKICQHTRHLLSPDGRLLAMKGTDISAELEELKNAGITTHVHKLEVPGVDKGRCLVEMRVSTTEDY